MNIIDPHIHLIDLRKGKYHWLKADSPPFWPDKELIYRNFDEKSVRLTDSLHLAGFIHVEAGFDNCQPENEIDWLEESVNGSFRSIACVNLTRTPSIFAQSLAKLVKRKSVIGVRHILDENALEILSSTKAQQNLALIAEQQLLFECQLSFYDTPAIKALAQLMNKLPNLTVIINHAGFVENDNSKRWQIWQNALKMLAQAPQLAIKCSGWEMVNRQYTPEIILETSQYCIEQLGKDRVMMASNFPLCLFSYGYQAYWQTVQKVLPLAQHQALCYENAKNWYKLA